MKKNRKEMIINVRLTKEDYKDLYEKADELEITVSSYIRSLIDNDKVSDVDVK